MRTLLRTIADLMDDEQWADAIGMLKANMSDVRESWELCWNLGWALFKIARHAEAATHLERAVELAPERPAAAWALGVVYSEMGCYDAAEVALRRSVELQSRYLNRASLALLYMRMNRFDQAEAVHLEGLAEKRTRERLESYADFLYDCGCEDEERAILVEAATAPAEAKRRR